MAWRWSGTKPSSKPTILGACGLFADKQLSKPMLTYQKVNSVEWYTHWKYPKIEIISFNKMFLKLPILRRISLNCGNSQTTGNMMTSSNGKISRVSGPVTGITGPASHFTGHMTVCPSAYPLANGKETIKPQHISTCGESTGHRWIPPTKASDAELWCFLWSAPQQTFEKKIETLAIWDAIAPIMTSL